MKKDNLPLYVDFENGEHTYGVVPNYEDYTCEWWRIHDGWRYKCDLADPAYEIMSPDEDWDTSFELYEYLKTEDMLKQGLFLAQVNAAVRSCLPEGQEVRFNEVSHSFKENLRLYRSDI